jgi:hypothetical protein
MVEVIGFIISLLALIYIFVKQSMPPKRRAEPSIEQEEEEMEDPLKDFLRSIERESAAREVVPQRKPPPPPKKKKEQKRTQHLSLEERRLASQLESRRLKSSLEERHLYKKEEEKPPESSRAQLAIQRLANRQDMLIYQEIMDKPKSLRS